MNDASTPRDGLAASIHDSFMTENYFDKAIEFGNLYKGLKKSCRNVRWKDSVVGYEANALKNTYLLRQDILHGRYKISPYQHFVVYEPKKREIVATRLRDRQFQKALCKGGLYDDIVEHLIYDNGACQTGKGTDFTLNRIVAHLRRYYLKHGADGWVPKCDVRKFFPSTPHDVAKKAILKRVYDQKAAKAVCDVIDSFEGDVGIGLGSQISQLVELCVLDSLDHYIKEQLRIKHYLRYMDDFILIHEDKAVLQDCYKKIVAFLTGTTRLELNKKTALYPLRQGVKMLNWRFVIKADTGRIVRYMNGKKLGKQRRKMRKLMEREQAGSLAEGTTEDSFRAWRANAKRGDTFYRRQRMSQYLYKIKGGKQYEQRTENAENRSCVRSAPQRNERCAYGGLRGCCKRTG